MTYAIGYSDRINHALAFAAKHHDQQVRRGGQLPYLTRPANVAIILTRYGRDEETVVAGILHDVVDDYIREGRSTGMLQERIGEKFGLDALDAALSVTERRVDDEGVEMTPEERRDDLLFRLASAGERGLWVFAADNIHAAGSLVADLERSSFQESVWSRSNATRGGSGVVDWFRRAAERLAVAGFAAAPLAELRGLVEALDRVGAKQVGARG